MIGRFRPCGIPGCRICRWDTPRRDDLPPAEPPSDTLAELLIGAAALAVLFIVAFVLVPVLAS